MNTEYEQGTYVGTPHHHNGYYAGDFSDRPRQSTPIKELMTIRLPKRVGPSW